MKKSSYENFFVNLSNKTKLGIILCLKDKPLCVNEIAEKTNGEQSNVSHHLKKLASCHILNIKKDGKQRIYSLNKETVAPMLKLVEQHVSKNCVVECGKSCKECEK